MPNYIFKIWRVFLNLNFTKTTIQTELYITINNSDCAYNVTSEKKGGSRNVLYIRNTKYKVNRRNDFD